MRERVYALFYRREKQYDLFQSALSVFLSRGRAGRLQALAIEAAQSHPAGGEPLFLWLGRTGLHHYHAAVHRGGLRPRDAGGALAGG